MFPIVSFNGPFFEKLRVNYSCNHLLYWINCSQILKKRFLSTAIKSLKQTKTILLTFIAVNMYAVGTTLSYSQRVGTSLKSNEKGSWESRDKVFFPRDLMKSTGGEYFIHRSDTVWSCDYDGSGFHNVIHRPVCVLRVELHVYNSTFKTPTLALIITITAKE